MLGVIRFVVVLSQWDSQLNQLDFIQITNTGKDHWILIYNVGTSHSPASVHTRLNGFCSG